MARRTKEILRRSRERSPLSKDRGTSEGRLTTTFEQINSIARRDARLEIGEKKNRLFLTNWWCRQYNRPLKDPLLNQYSIEELAYEYFLAGEVTAYKQELIDQENDRIEEDKIQVDHDWADEMEAEDAAREEAEAKAKVDKEKAEEEAYDPLKDPEQVKWMEEEIEKSKTVFGEDFGEDVGVEFEDED
jgi:hypothetical protein